MAVRNYHLSGLSTSYHTHPCFTLSEKPHKKTRLLSLSTSKCLVSCICTACLSCAVRAIQPSFSFITVCLLLHLWAVFLSVRKQLSDNVQIVDYLLPQIKLEKGEIKPRQTWNVFLKSDRRTVYASMKEVIHRRTHGHLSLG